MAQAASSLEEGNAGLLSGYSRRGTDSYRSITGKSLKYCYDNVVDKGRPGSVENKINFVLWIFSISLDPLICYVVSINDEKKMIETNIALISAIWILHWLLMICRFCTPFLSNKKGRQFFIWTESLTFFFSNIGLLCVVFSTTIKIKFPVFPIILAMFLVMYSVRIIRIYKLFMEELTRTSCHQADTALIKIVLNLMLYLYGGHLFGGWWYLLAVCEKMICWKQACRNHSGCRFSNRHFIVNSGDNKFLNDYCFAMTEDIKTSEFGILKDAFESHIVNTKKFLNKLLYCFRWGLQNISGFGQNLQVSTRRMENFLAILIVIYGLGTFTFFIGNMQNLIKYTTERSEERKRKEDAIKRKHQELEQWCPFGKLSEELQNHIREYQQNIWQQTEHVDVENLVNSYVPKDLKYNIKREFCLDSLKKVDKFGRWGDALLIQLCECVKPVVYPERTRIMHEGDPIDEMLFVVQGKLWTYSSRTNTTGSTSNVTHESIKDHLKDGDSWGEELVDWVQNNLSSSNIPISSRTIQSLTKVEAFVLGAYDLKNLFISNQNVLFIQSFFRYRKMLLTRRKTQMSTQE